MKVKDFIEQLKNMDQEAIVCSFEVYDEEVIYNSIEMCQEIQNVHYFNDYGNEVFGNIVSIN